MSSCVANAPFRSWLVAASVALAGCGAAADLVTAPKAEDGGLGVALAHTILLKDPGCTGIRVGGGLVVTAAHCVDEMELGADYSGFKLGYVSPDYDFAVMSGDKEIDPVALVDAAIGQHVYVVGYPVSIDDGEQQLTVTDGVFTGAVDGYMQRLTSGCYYGNSGGGAWSASGLIGVVVEIRPVADTQYGPLPFPFHCYTVPAKLLRDVML